MIGEVMINRQQPGCGLSAGGCPISLLPPTKPVPAGNEGYGWESPMQGRCGRGNGGGGGWRDFRRLRDEDRHCGPRGHQYLGPHLDQNVAILRVVLAARLRLI